MKRLILLIFLLLLIPDAGIANQPEKTSLKIALLPTPDALPIYVAQKLKLFEKEGVQVEILPVGSAVARDQLIQAQRADGMVNEIQGAVNFNRNNVRIKIVAIVREPRKNAPLFRILAAPGNTFSKAGDLAGVAIGISKNTIIEYVTERLLSANGLIEEEMKFYSVPAIPERFQLLLSGQIKAATLPDPLAASAMAAGAVEIVNDAERPDISVTTLSFTKKAIETNKSALSAFMRAWNQAAEKINADPEQWRALFLAKIRVPENMQKSYQLPVYSVHSLPTRSQWDDVVAWMKAKKQLVNSLAYEESVCREFSGEK